MGATNNIKTLFFSSDLLSRTCKNCNSFFTDTDYKNDNWELEYRTNHNADFSSFRQGTSRGAISIFIELYHEDCPIIKDKHPLRTDHGTNNEYK